MNSFLYYFIITAVLVLMGLVSAFLFILSYYKYEIWNNIEFKGEENE